MNCLPDVSALLNSNNHANFSMQTMFNKKTGISPIFCQNLLCKIFFLQYIPILFLSKIIFGVMFVKILSIFLSKHFRMPNIETKNEKKVSHTRQNAFSMIHFLIY